MRILVTGAAGFVGRHLLPELRAAGHEPVGFDRPGTQLPGDIPLRHGELLRAADVAAAFRELRPDACIHLAGIAFVPMGWKDPRTTFEVNLVGVIGLLEAARAYNPRLRLLVVSSAQVYGHEPADAPLREDDPRRPDNLYGLSKFAADQAALLYARHHGLPVMTARPLNHIGPGQAREFVVSAFVEQCVAIARGRQPPEMRVGNLESRRDFMDVRDTVRGYRLLIERGRPATAYNLAGGRLWKIGELLEMLCGIAGIRPRLIRDEKLYRPTDESPRLDIARIREDVGWQPEIPLEKSLRDLYEEQLRRES